MRWSLWLVLGAAIGLAGAGWALLRPPAPGLEQQVRRHPTRSDLRLRLAASLAVQGRRFSAIEQWEVARGLDPTLSAASLAALYAEAGEPEAAAGIEPTAARRLDLGEFRRAVEAAPSSAPTRRARLHMLAGEWETAERLLRSVPSGPESDSLLGFTLSLLGKTDEGIALLRASGAGAWELFLLGQAHRTAGDPVRALQAWLEATKAPDAPPAARTGAACLMARLGRTSQAEALLQSLHETAVEEPQYWEAVALIEERKRRRGLELLARGHAALHSGETGRAAALYREGLERLGSGRPEPEVEVRTALFRGLLDDLERRLDTPGAERLTADAVGRTTSDAFFLRRRAELLVEQSRFAEALALVERLPPAEAPWETEDLRARIGLESGDGARLQAAAGRCLALEPRRPEPLMLQAEWSSNHGQGAERSLALYDQAAAAAPENAEVHAQRGVVLVRLRRWEEGAQALRRALDLDPRVLEGVPHAQLVLACRHLGQEREAAFHERRYRVLRRLKDDWASLLPGLRQPRPAGEYERLGRVALDRHQHWIALTAFKRGLAASPPRELKVRLWEGVAAAEKRRGHFFAALDSMRQSHLLRSRGAIPGS